MILRQYMTLSLHEEHTFRNTCFNKDKLCDMTRHRFNIGDRVQFVFPKIASLAYSIRVFVSEKKQFTPTLFTVVRVNRSTVQIVECGESVASSVTRHEVFCVGFFDIEPTVPVLAHTQLVGTVKIYPQHAPQAPAKNPSDRHKRGAQIRYENETRSSHHTPT